MYTNHWVKISSDEEKTVLSKCVICQNVYFLGDPHNKCPLHRCCISRSRLYWRPSKCLECSEMKTWEEAIDIEKRVGLPSHLITEILLNWRKLNGINLSNVHKPCSLNSKYKTPYPLPVMQPATASSHISPLSRFLSQPQTLYKKSTSPTQSSSCYSSSIKSISINEPISPLPNSVAFPLAPSQTSTFSDSSYSSYSSDDTFTNPRSFSSTHSSFLSSSSAFSKVSSISKVSPKAMLYSSAKKSISASELHLSHIPHECDTALSAPIKNAKSNCGCKSRTLSCKTSEGILSTVERDIAEKNLILSSPSTALTSFCRSLSPTVLHNMSSVAKSVSQLPYSHTIFKGLYSSSIAHNQNEIFPLSSDISLMPETLEFSSFSEAPTMHSVSTILQQRLGAPKTLLGNVYLPVSYDNNSKLAVGVSSSHLLHSKELIPSESSIISSNTAWSLSNSPSVNSVCRILSEVQPHHRSPVNKSSAQSLSYSSLDNKCTSLSPCRRIISHTSNNTKSVANISYSMQTSVAASPHLNHILPATEVLSTILPSLNKSIEASQKRPSLPASSGISSKSTVTAPFILKKNIAQIEILTSPVLPLPKKLCHNSFPCGYSILSETSQSTIPIPQPCSLSRTDLFHSSLSEDSLASQSTNSSTYVKSVPSAKRFKVSTFEFENCCFQIGDKVASDLSDLQN